MPRPTDRKRALAALACCIAAQTAFAQGDVFSSGGGRTAPPGGGPMYGNGAYGRDPECGGTDRSYYDRQYNSHGIVVSIEVMQQVYRRTLVAPPGSVVVLVATALSAGRGRDTTQ